MKQIKLLSNDTQCFKCKRVVNRRKAEAEDWADVTFVDQTGMPVHKAHACQHCQEHLDGIDHYQEPDGRK